MKKILSCVLGLLIFLIPLGALAGVDFNSDPHFIISATSVDISKDQNNSYLITVNDPNINYFYSNPRNRNFGSSTPEEFTAIWNKYSGLAGKKGLGRIAWILPNSMEKKGTSIIPIIKNISTDNGKLIIEVSKNTETKSDKEFKTEPEVGHFGETTISIHM